MDDSSLLPAGASSQSDSNSHSSLTSQKMNTREDTMHQDSLVSSNEGKHTDLTEETPEPLSDMPTSNGSDEGSVSFVKDNPEMVRIVVRWICLLLLLLLLYWEQIVLTILLMLA